MSAVVPVMAEDVYQSPSEMANTYIPRAPLENYWKVYGGPELSASIPGTNEFSRGETVSVYIDLTNYGRIMGFKEDKKPDTPTEYALANEEQKREMEKTAALGIKATLVSNSSEIEIKSGDQVVESLRTGEKTKSPMKFTVKIGKHAPAGRYPLELRLGYQYQYNVEVYASNLDQKTGSLVGFETSYWFDKANKTLILPLYVKKAADFSIKKATGTLVAGEKKGTIQVTYINQGEEAIRDSIARISIFKPFSSTDDQAYIGDMAAGEEKTVVFRIDTDADATPKEYGINSEIKYTDVNGDTIISESMKIPVTVKAQARSIFLPLAAGVVLVVVVGGYLYKKRKQKKA
jgi:hypothetical protein